MEHEFHEFSELHELEIEERIIYKELSFKIMEAVFEVHRVLGPGFSENIYEEALAKELRDKEIPYDRQKLIEVYYKDEKMGEYRLDMLIANKIVLELKAVSELNETFASQLLSYLKATGLNLGILLNFGRKSIEYRRIVN